MQDAYCEVHNLLGFIVYIYLCYTYIHLYIIHILALTYIICIHDVYDMETGRSSFSRQIIIRSRRVKGPINHVCHLLLSLCRSRHSHTHTHIYMYTGRVVAAAAAAAVDTDES